MAKTDKDIVLISQDSAFSDRIGALVRRQPGFALQACNATLSTMNGKAVELARTSELIIFQASTNTASDIEALKGIAKSGSAARILAVSDSTVPFGLAHSLLQVGATEVVPDTVADAELSRIVNRLSMPRRLTLTTPDLREGQVIAVSKARGGIGATTLAVNLAVLLGDAVAGDAGHAFTRNRSALPEWCFARLTELRADLRVAADAERADRTLRQVLKFLLEGVEHRRNRRIGVI